MAAEKRLCFNAPVLTRRFARHLWVGLSSCATALGVYACGDTVKVPFDENQQTGNGFVIPDGQDDGEVPLLSADATCLTEVNAAERKRVALYVMLDSSVSMLEPAGSATEEGSSGNKWQAVQRAMRNFMIESADSDLSLGLQFFPLAKPGSSFTCESHADCGRNGGPCFLSTCAGGNTISLCQSDSECPDNQDCVDFGLCSNSDPAAPLACLLGSGPCANGLGRCEDFERTCTNATDCNPGRYSEPAVEIGPISDAYDAVDAALVRQIPQGLTPSGPALEGAITHAREWAVMHPEYAVVTVFATDGLPTECGPVVGELPPIDQITTIASRALANEVPIQTFVIGVFQPGDGTSINNVNAIAQAGGTDEALFIDPEGAVDEQFVDALQNIRNGALACQLQLPTTDEQLDYFRVNLLFDNGPTVKQLSFVSDEAGCAQEPNGWHYDVDATVTRPSSIKVCPQVCDEFKTAPTTSSSIRLQLGCATILQ